MAEPPKEQDRLQGLMDELLSLKAKLRDARG